MVDKVADELMFYMEQCGAYRLKDKALIQKLAEMVLTTNKKGKQIISRDWWEGTPTNS